MEHGAISVGIAFWVFVAVTSVAGIVADYKKRKLKIEPLRAAIERGQTLDPAVLDRLLHHEQPAEDINPEHLKIGGIITMSAGVGIILLSFCIWVLAPVALFPVLGAGALVLCVGIGILVSANVVQQNRRQTNGPRA